MRFSYLMFFLMLGLLQACVAPVVAAGVGTGLMMTSADRRSAGTMVEDDTIETKGQKRIEEKYKDTAHASVTAYNRFALITGTAANENTKMDIERIVGSIPNVKGIANELVVGDTAKGGSASTDTRITGNVKLRFVKTTAFKADHVKVVTENSVVYLMGLVTRAEADVASDIASTTAGVSKVVRVFEYID
jgi:osmotically-inducible protein OsmY